jgi:hypothetical protein
MSMCEQPDRHDDTEIDRILGLSDDEVLAECRASGEDPEQIATEMRAIFDRTVLMQSGWWIAVIAFRQVLGGITRQDMTIRDLRRLLLANRKTGLNVAGPSHEIAAYINSLEPLK